MLNLFDFRDIDRFFFREREKFDLGFIRDCRRGWCVFMNNLAGI